MITAPKSIASGKERPRIRYASKPLESHISGITSPGRVYRRECQTLATTAAGNSCVTRFW